MELVKLIDKLEKKYPIFLKEEWDNVGLSIGDTSADIKKAVITLDVTDKVIDFAIENGAELIIAHHPLIFKAVGNITNKSYTGKKVLKMMKNNINLYVAHTNADSAAGGLNDYVIKKLGGENSKIADPKYFDVVKITVYVPENSAEELREKLNKINRFSYNGYSGVSYTGAVEETFYAGKETNPYNGEKGDKNICNAKKIEMLVLRNQVKELVGEIKKLHPYEEPAYEITEVDKRFIAGGIGRIYDLGKKIKISEYIKSAKEKLGISVCRAVYDEDREIKRIGVVNGGGMSFMRKVKDAGAELFLTADIKYHEALEAKEMGIALADMGHYETEKFFGEMVAGELGDTGVECIIFTDSEIFKNY